MRAALEPWIRLDEVGSTQDVAASLLSQGMPVGVVFAEHQSQGRGRFRREWTSAKGDSLTFSLVFSEYKGHPRPWLIGMAVALAVAQTLEAKLQWPNDVVIEGKKVAGVLVELLPSDAEEKVPVVGVGANLNQEQFPEGITGRATSLKIERGTVSSASDVAERIVRQIASLPEPDSWSELEPLWTQFDETAGKAYVLPNGEKALALRIGKEGALVCIVDGAERTVMAAQAWFGE